MSTKKKMFLSAAGAAGGGGLDVDEVFSTFLYNGNGGSQSIVNNIDLAGEGGLVWTKTRSGSGSNYLQHKTSHYAISNSMAEEQADARLVTQFNSNGYNLGIFGGVNGNGDEMVSWTFRKAPKFFDVQTWTGNGAADRAISHNLDSVPGMIVVKRTQGGSEDWAVWHREVHNNSSQIASLNKQAVIYTSNSVFEQINPTSTNFYVGDHPLSNSNGDEYVAYLFAHNNNDGEFGPSADQDIIKCGLYIGNGSSTGPEVNLGFEPQWLLVKNINNGSADWLLLDDMRGWSDGDADYFLEPNTTFAEQGNQNWVDITSTGFKMTNANGQINGNGQYHIYMAIRRGSLVEPDDATKVFDVKQGVNSVPAFPTSFSVDMALSAANISSTVSWRIRNRLTSANYLVPNDTSGETVSTSATYRFDLQTGYGQASNLTNVYAWLWKRAPGYFDTVLYTGTGSNRTVTHNLGAAPEMMWIKARVSGGYDWMVYHKGISSPNSKMLKLNEDGVGITRTALLNDTAPAETQFTVGTDNLTNNNGTDFVAYLFATVAGVSKVGSFTLGSSGSSNIDCGFSSGAKFILAKKSNGTGGWLIWDTVRGIVAGNDPYLLLNSTGSQTGGYDFVDPYSQGFTIPNAAYWGAGDYIFYAIA